jgi:cytochrome c553
MGAPTPSFHVRPAIDGTRAVRAGTCASGLIRVSILAGSLAGAAHASPADGGGTNLLPIAQTVLEGYRRFNGVCSHCHGPDGVGSTFAPSLVDRPIYPETFRAAILQGSRTGASVMRGFADDPNVVPYIDAIRTYLDARQRGLIGRGRPPEP